MRIITHMNVDLDAVCSVWAARKFVPQCAGAPVEFRRADWNGIFETETIEVVLILDMDAGGLGLKGEKDADGTVHSCFASIVSRFASEDEKRALDPLIRFVDAQDAHGSAVRFLAPEASKDAQRIIMATGINAVLRAFQAVYVNDDERVVEKMSEILDGLLKNARGRLGAEAEADKAFVHKESKVAILVDARHMATMGVLFERGVRVVVYVDGNNIGLVRGNDVTIRMDHPSICKVVEDVGEISEWFKHSAGFLFSRGTRKAPATSLSKVSPSALARAAAKLL